MWFFFIIIPFDKRKGQVKTFTARKLTQKLVRFSATNSRLRKEAIEENDEFLFGVVNKETLINLKLCYF